MKIKFFSALGFSFLATLFVAFYPTHTPTNDPKTNEAKESLIMKGVLSALDQLHYEPIKLNDELSERAYNSYLDRLDGGKRFLTQKELARLSTYKYQLDDQFKEGSLEFFNLSLEIIESAIERPATWYPEILDSPMDFKVNEEYIMNPEDEKYCRDETALKDRWRQMLKYEVLTKLHRKVEEQEKNDSIQVKKTFEQLEQDAREEVKKIFDGWYNRIKSLRRSDRFSDYVNSMTELYDPHSNYFDPKDKEDFDINMSGRLEGIGARLQSDGELTKVESVVPGGPAWKQKELEQNDQILKVAQLGEEPVDIRGMRIDDVVKLVRGKKGTKVILTVRKPDGSQKDITIVRDEVILDEGLAKSAVLDHSEIIDNIGYIKLPRFYADFERKDGNSCAKDVANEIEKLKRKNVKGIILDLRNNGGGSLKDVIDMSGLFIENGPIVQVKSRDQRPQVLSDSDKNVQYTGPLIVMVNTFSASASEILAAALQDYNRALIVGSNNTFGKGTVQRFYDLDRMMRGGNEFKPLGDIKLTMQKFYRINGGSTQLRGVTPDIILPDPYMFLNIGEREYDHPMEWSEIDPLTYNQNAFKVKNMDVIKAKSQSRISQDTSFVLIQENAKRLKEQRDQKSVPLNYDKYHAMIKQREAEAKKYEHIMKHEIKQLSAKNLEEDLASIQIDESKVARNNSWLESLRKDIYIQESLALIKDMMQDL